MTNREYPDHSDGIWDDDEWISWDWINGHIDKPVEISAYADVDPELIDLFEQLVDIAQRHKALTGRYLQIWGELGELYAEVRFGIQRHRAKAQGSDGRLGDDFVEVKTISPEKSTLRVEVKRSGHFNKLVVVRIDEHFRFEAKMVNRKDLGQGTGKLVRYKWSGPTDCKVGDPD